MALPFGIVINGIDAFLLVFVRFTGLFVIAPIFGRRNIPAYYKIGFSFILAMIMVNTVKMPAEGLYDSLLTYSLLVAEEFIVGITLGFVAYMIFTAVYIAGQLIDTQIGFSIVNVFDPLSNIQVPVTSNFYYILCMLIFMIMNGHHILIAALFQSFEAIPLGSAVFNTALMDDLLRLFSTVFLIAFKISAPVIAAIMISDIALGIITKTVPQINIFVVGMPLKIILGLFVMLLTIPALMAVADTLVNGMNSELLNFIKDMGPLK